MKKVRKQRFVLDDVSTYWLKFVTEKVRIVKYSYQTKFVTEKVRSGKRFVMEKVGNGKGS